MTLVKFELRYPNGHHESIVVEGERALIGSASHCDVRLPVDQSAHEHVLVEVMGDTLRAEVRVPSPPVSLDGLPFTAGPIDPGAVLGIGRSRLLVVLVPQSATSVGKGAKSNRASQAAIRIAAVAVLVLVGYLLLQDGGTKDSPEPALGSLLFAAPNPSCPHGNPAKALAFAGEQLDLANGKRERLPFVVKEGVAAIALYQTAATCFRRGGATQSAREAEEAAQSLERDLSDDLRARRLRLRRMLAVQDYELAKRDVTVLLALTEGKHGAYVEWLRGIADQHKAKGMQ